MPRNRILIAATLILLVGAICLAIDLNRAGRREVLGQFNALQTLLARQAVHEASSYLQECSWDLQGLSVWESVRNGDRSMMQKDFRDYLESANHVRTPAIVLVNEHGSLVLSTEQHSPVVDYSSCDFYHWAKDPESTGKVFVSSWAHMAMEGVPQLTDGRFFVATPVYRGRPDVLSTNLIPVFSGVLVMTIDLKSVLTNHLEVLNPQFKSHRVWIMDDDGTILLHSEHPEMARENIHLLREDCKRCHESFNYAKDMLEVRTGVLEYQVTHAPRKLAAFAPMRFANASWIVVVNAPLAEVTSFVQQSYARMLLLVLAMAAATGLAVLIVHQSNISKVRAVEEARRWQDKHRLEEHIRRAEERYP